MRNRLFFKTFFEKRMLPEMVYTVLASVLLYPLLRILFNRFMKEKPQSALMENKS